MEKIIDFNRPHASFAGSKAVFMDNSIFLPSEASPEAQAAELRSDRMRFIGAVLDVAIQWCRDHGVREGSQEAIDALEEAHSIATGIAWTFGDIPFAAELRKGLSAEKVSEAMAMKLPHRTHLLEHIVKHGGLQVSKDELGEATGAYVAGRFKAPQLDRALLTALTHAEISAFFDEMSRKDYFTGRRITDNLEPVTLTSLLWSFAVGTLKVVGLAGVIALLPLLIPSIPAQVTGWISIGIVALWVIIVAILLIAGGKEILVKGPELNKSRAKIRDLLDAMRGFFLEFYPAGPLSTRHFRERVEHLASMGVVWPSALYVLLDDMEARGVRSF